MIRKGVSTSVVGERKCLRRHSRACRANRQDSHGPLSGPACPVDDSVITGYAHTPGDPVRDPATLMEARDNAPSQPEGDDMETTQPRGRTAQEARAIAEADADLFETIVRAWPYLREQTKNQLVTIAESEANEDPEYRDN